MPSLSELPGNIKQKKLLMALKRLGFVINKNVGTHHGASVQGRDIQILFKKQYFFYYL